MKKTLLFLLFSIFTTAQSLDTTFGYNGVSTEYQNTVNSSQVIYDEVIQNDILYRVGYVRRNNVIKGIIAGYNTSGIFMNKEVGSVALQTVCFQADDKVVTAGQNKIYRILPNNNFDTSFNTSGNQTINFGTFPMNIKCISTQADGKIVVSGYVSNGTNNDFAIARLNVDGSFDTTFDSDGMQTIALGTSNEQAFSHKMQTDGKIVVVGESFIANYDFAIVRLNTNGSLDTTFNGTGKKTIDYATSSIDRARSFEILSDGKIVIFGQVAGTFGCMKLDADGISLDTSFGSSGKKTFTDLLSMSTGITPTSVHLIPKIKVLPDGKMILNGTSNSDVKFMKLQTNGQSDTTYGTNGVVVVTNDIDTASSFRFNSSGGIIFTGTTTSATSNGNFKIFDGFISNNGLTVNSSTNFLYNENYFKDFQVLSDGSYLKLIYIHYLNLVRLIKYLPDGSIDVTFGVSGIVNMSSSDNILTESYINVFSDKIYVSTNTEIYKFNSNGTPDVTFDSDGKITINDLIVANNSNYALQYINDFKIDELGNLFLAVDLIINSPFSISYGILKISNNGILINSFANNGLYTTRFESDLNIMEFPRRILFQNDGKIVVVGFSQLINGSNNKYISLRLNLNGVLDSSYGTSGKNSMQFSTGPLDNVVNNVFILNDNSVYSFVNINGVYKNVKFLTNGNVNLSHGTNGVSNDVIGTTNYAMAVQPDGKILKAGKKNEQFSISRYNVNGSIDTTFGINGEVNVVSLGIDTDWDFVESSFSKILLQPDGKIILGGNSFDGSSQLSTLVRLTNTTLGTLDFSSTNNALSIYPNPIETSATFEFTLLNPENITIELYNVQGKLVQTIATNKEMASGNHNLPIELNQNLTSGNYFLKLTTANGSQSIQIIKK
ncbi:T9SS type A sorting domain-containing protein [Flavobacterium sp. F372]|uniref:T9SS type A sorting domain-containing protein n=1 Tax=Flavobacterium bernardetii TaxID=2813823 RepID=A0ABR7J0M5_9FLAO|nr:T9SS type A sorting domain-containing protein [Flavobacterium bernardetii]MBC5835589.1 T9SS type A sorting domain-containing protein [Flavobacterium bernardetii]NHF70953.1 T9SS type A sorting domain-containing protein [Flavobacterium bernardetii]